MGPEPMTCADTRKKEEMDVQVEPCEETDAWLQPQNTGAAGRGRKVLPRALGETVALSVP